MTIRDDSFEFIEDKLDLAFASIKPTKRRTRPVKAKCMNCGKITPITDKDQPCPCCMLCGSLAWQDVKGLK